MIERGVSRLVSVDLGGGRGAIGGKINSAFVPPFPPRQLKPLAKSRGFFGERRHGVIWLVRVRVPDWRSEAEYPRLQRPCPVRSGHVQQVLLDNAANPAEPDIVKSLLSPIIGRGLLTSDGDG